MLALAIALLVSAVAHRTGLNAATAALVLHTTVLLLAAWRTFAAGIAASLAATASFTFFLDPFGSWRVDAPSNWIALVSFLIASTLTSRLVSRARHEAARAEARRSELAALYRLSVELFTATDAESKGRDTALELSLAALQARGGGIVAISPDGSVTRERWHGVEDAHLLSRCRTALQRANPASFPAPAGSTVCVPQSAEGSLRRVFVAVETRATPRAVESVGALLALEMEHDRALAASAHAEALEESHALKTSILRAVSHDLNTPLTAVSLELDALARELAEDPQAMQRIMSLREDTTILRRRIENLLAMARLEAGAIVPRPEPVSPADLFLGVRRHMDLATPGRSLSIQVEEDCPEIDADPSLLLEILVNLVDNAHRASPSEEAIEIRAEQIPDGVRLTVADRGIGVPHGEGAGEEVLLQDLPSRGLGLEIARAFTAASAGKLALLRREGGGTLVRIDLPAWNEAEAST